MSAAVCTVEQFLRDVAKHEMTVLRDDGGTGRHVRFKQPGTSNMFFDLITWPGFLCYTGDMGTYVFQRLSDMFEFFRTDRQYQRRPGRRLAVNFSYWGEKLEAVGKHDGFREFSEEKFRANIMDQVAQCGLTGKLGHGLRDELESEVLEHAADGVHAAYEAAMRFTYNGKRPFADFYEVNCEEYTHRFVWCCYALAWGIEQYDLARDHAEALEMNAAPAEAVTA